MTETYDHPELDLKVDVLEKFKVSNPFSLLERR